jgi:hypothetical protein
MVRTNLVLHNSKEAANSDELTAVNGCRPKASCPRCGAQVPVTTCSVCAVCCAHTFLLLSDAQHAKHNETHELSPLEELQLWQLLQETTTAIFCLNNPH